MKQGFIFMALLVSIYGYSQTTPLFKTGNTVLKSIAVSPDGRTVAIEGESSEVALWDLGARKKVMTLKPELINTDATTSSFNAVLPIAFGSSNKLFFSPDGQRLFLWHKQGLVVWNLKVEKPLIEFLGRPDHVDVSTDGKFIVMSKERNFIPAKIRGGLTSIYMNLYSTDSGEMKKISTQSESEEYRFRFVPASTNILVSGIKGDLRLLDYNSGQTTQLQKPYASTDEYWLDSSSDFISPRVSMAMHPSKELAALTDNSKIYIVDFKKGSLEKSINMDASKITLGFGLERLEFIANGKYLVGIGSNMEFKKCIMIWDIYTGKEVKTMFVNPIFFALSFSPDGKFFTLSKADDLQKPIFEISFFDLQTLKPLGVIKGKGVSSFFPNDPKRLIFLNEESIFAHTLNPPN